MFSDFSKVIKVTAWAEGWLPFLSSFSSDLELISELWRRLLLCFLNDLQVKGHTEKFNRTQKGTHRKCSLTPGQGTLKVFSQIRKLSGWLVRCQIQRKSVSTRLMTSEWKTLQGKLGRYAELFDLRVAEAKITSATIWGRGGDESTDQSHSPFPASNPLGGWCLLQGPVFSEASETLSCCPLPALSGTASNTIGPSGCASPCVGGGNGQHTEAAPCRKAAESSCSPAGETFRIMKQRENRGRGGWGAGE